MNTIRVLALLPLFVVLAHSFSWDIVVGEGKQLKFYKDRSLIHIADNPSSEQIHSVTYDPVQFRVLFADFQSDSITISSFDLKTKKIQTLVTRPTSATYNSLAYDPVTQLLFWTADYKIYSLSLRPTSSDIAVEENLLVTLEHYCWDIAVNNCEGYIYWVTKHNIERAAFNGSGREVLPSGEAYWRRSLAIDHRLQKMYWTEETTYNQFSIKMADLNGKNRRTFYDIGTEYGATSIAVSRDFIYWRSHSQAAILQLPKHQQFDVAPVTYSDSTASPWYLQLTAANYTIKEQSSGKKGCETLKSLIHNSSVNNSLDDSLKGSACHNYCLQGNCTISAEGQPKCSCEAGHSGERCEINACHMYCLNNGVCSLNETEKPVCQCTADYEGERCDVSICKDYCMHGNCNISTEGQLSCSCEAGYSGERCDVYACHMYCLNNGVCSLNEAKKPVCQCTADYEGERCDVSICKDYCMHGNCSVSTEGQLTCRCNVGYSGERCEVNACHSYCLNDGECSLNEEDEPFCQCTADYEGERCDVSTTLPGSCDCADKMTQQILRSLRIKVNQVISEELQCPQDQNFARNQ